jgi:hypothetical protein
MSSKDNMPQEVSNEFLDEFYDSDEQCYMIQVDGELDYFDLHPGDILLAQESPPKSYQLVACSLPDRINCLVIGRYILRKGQRVLLESLCGIPTVLMVSKMVTVFHVIKHIGR